MAKASRQSKLAHCLFLAGSSMASCLYAFDVSAAGTTAPGYTVGLPIYAIFPESLILVNQTQSSFKNVNGREVRVNAEVPFFVYYPGWDILGGKAMIVFAPALLDVSVANGSNSFGVYNTYGGAGVNWEIFDGLFAGYRLSGYFPQGGTVGLDYGTIEQRAGFTYLKDGWLATANFMYGTPISPGLNASAPDYGIFEGSVVRSIGKFGVGLVGYAYTDLTKNVVSRRQSNAAVGGLVSYDFGPVVLQVKVTQDVYRRNYGGHETTFWTNLIIPLWAPKSLGKN